jgi:superfamily II DNA or RNA helicase
MTSLSEKHEYQLKKLLFSKEEIILLNNDPELSNRSYQLEALLNIINKKKCLVKMFCGTGKSRIITNVITYQQKELNVVVFPSLALINQFSSDYSQYFYNYKIINISSENLPHIKTTTNISSIKKFLKSGNSKLVLVTYQSFDVLLNCLETKNVGSVLYDEAHHVVSPEYQKLVFNTNYFEQELFFTATPRNENGITMLDTNHPENNMCGELAYNYTYLQGLDSKVLNEFEICVDMYTENTNNNLYEAMARAILKRNTSRVLCFHSGVNGESNTDVKNFVNLKAFKKALTKIQKEEFPEKSGYYTKITFKGIDGQTPSCDRKNMLQALDDTPTTQIYILSSCGTIGEGVDTKKANMCVFADPKSSVTKIIQNIGRVVRRNNDHPMSTVLIPCFVDMNNYAEVLGDPEKQDEIIRKQMRMPNGDYAPILNVLSALKQEDPDIYDMCLNYPNRKHKKDSLKKQGFKIHESKVTYSSEEVEQIKNSGETPLEIHTNETIERFNETPDENETMLRLYHDDDDNLYKPIVPCKKTNTWEEVNNQIIQPPKPKKKAVSMSIHQNDEITMLWSVKGELDFSKKFCSTVIECNVSYGIEKWKITVKKVIDYIEKEKKSPSAHDKNRDIKKLGQWINNQKKNYSKDKEIMSNPEIRKEWEETVNKYKEYLVIDNEELWKMTLKKVIDYIKKEKKNPSTHDKNPNIKKLGQWINNQKKNYSKDKEIMSNPEIRKEWEETVNKYKEYLGDREELWKITLKKVIDYIEKEKKLPNTRNINEEIKKLGNWICNQKKNYLKNEQIMSNPEIRKEWEITLVKYKKYLNQPVIDSSNSEDKQILTQSKVKNITKKQKDIPKVKESQETNSHKSPSPSEIGKLHKTYRKMRSENLHQKFKQDPQLWLDYHKTREQNFASYEKESIPTNRIIKELEKIKTKRQKIVVDMGCGKADIAHYFKKTKDNRFLFYNYDHQSGGDKMIQEVDISVLPLEDASVEIAIMSLALWGTKENRIQYIREAYRVLESGGKFYISDTTKKWSPKELTKENGGELLRNLLTENGFKIISEEVGVPFCFFVCSKEY